MPEELFILRFRKVLTVQPNSDVSLCSNGISQGNTGKVESWWHTYSVAHYQEN